MSSFFTTSKANDLGSLSESFLQAIALETSKGEFAFGLALGMVLLSVALVINLFLNLLQQR